MSHPKRYVEITTSGIRKSDLFWKQVGSLWASLSGSVGKNPPAMQEPQEIRVRSLGWEDPLEEEMATHSSALAWRTPRTEEPGGLQSTETQRVGHD